MSTITNQLGSGALSGLTTTVCLQPLDLLKTRMQQVDRQIRPKHSTSLLFITINDIVTKNGWQGLWRGTGATLMRNIPGVAIYMTALTQLRTRMASSPSFAALYKQPRTNTANSSVLPTLTSTGNLISGAMTRVGIGLALNPLSLIKVRYESNMYAYRSLLGALASTVRQGPRELLRGFVATSLRDAPYAGIFVLFYEGIKRETSYLVPPTSTYHSTAIHGLSAALAGTIATLTTQPFDVIKTKIQVRQEDKYRGFIRTVSTIWKQRGVRGYFDGASLRMSRKVLSASIGWTVYEAILMFMRNSKPHS